MDFFHVTFNVKNKTKTKTTFNEKKNVESLVICISDIMNGISGEL